MSQTQCLLLRSETSEDKITDALQLFRALDKRSVTLVKTDLGNTLTLCTASAPKGPSPQHGLVTVSQSETGFAGNMHLKPGVEWLDAIRGDGHLSHLRKNTGRTCLCVIRHQ